MESLIFTRQIPIFLVCLWVILSSKHNHTYANDNALKSPQDTLPKQKSKYPTYTEKDRRGDHLSNKPSSSPLLLEEPSNIKKSVELDSSGQYYYIDEKIGDFEYRAPTFMTYEEFQKYQQQQMIRNYWKKRSYGDSSGLSTRKDPKTGPLSLKIKAPGLGSIFGSDYVDIRPNGLVTLDFGYRFQHVFNPQIPVRQQRQGNFEFDNNIQMNVVGKIGEKLKLTVNWDTKATFEFQNNFKVEYTGFEEDILQKVEVGQVSMPVNTTLISGAQNLFGVKTKSQFGRMTMTSVFSSQRGKVEEVRAQGGSVTRTFELRADNYDEYRHFFIGHFFRDIYESSLATLPIVNSGVNLSQIDVYITNTTSATQNLQNIVAFTDLGEAAPHIYNPSITSSGSNLPASNKVNSLNKYVEDPTLTTGNIESILQADGLQKGTDYEILTNARKLKPEDFTYNPQLGYISLVTPLRSYEILAVAYKYTYNGAAYTVGQTTGDFTLNNPDASTNNTQNNNKIIVVKLLKPSTIRTRLPTWDLMMKNVYLLGTTQVSRENFQLRVIYKDDISGADIPNLQEGKNTKNIPLIRLLGLDKLNPNNDPFPDGNFDYVEGVTIDSKYGRIFFPVLEPFGEDLKEKFDQTTEADLVNKYVYFELYDSTKSDASLIAAKNKFFLRGKFQSSSSSEIPLSGALNLAQGSVVVTAGSRTLVEGTDYTVDYNQGKVKILNEGILTSGQEVKIRYEKQDLFNFRRKAFFGNRFDYRVNKDINLGATILRQSEAPTITRVNIGDEPSANTIWGIDANIKKESRFLTKMVDKLPIIQTKAPSSITASGEFAQLLPGYNKALDLNGDKGGAAFIDDFEAAETPTDLVRTPTKWRHSSTPARFSQFNQNGLPYGYKRALLAWYNIDNVFYQTGGENKPKNIPDEIKNHFQRAISPQEVFPNLNRQQVNANQITLDLAYYPSERGPYNYDPAMNPDGTLPNPAQNWAGITRDIRNDIDFDNANVQYIEFWLMSPYIEVNSPPQDSSTYIDGKPFNQNNKGKLYFNLGNISEDVLKDGRQAAENGLPTNTTIDFNSPWGKVVTPLQPTFAFDNTPGSRAKQDVGLDGINNAEEQLYFANTPAAQLPDPAADDFRYYLGEASDRANLNILQRYKHFNGLENNSPDASNATGNIVPSSSTLPDNEDINQDNSLNTLDEYYEYEVDIDKARFDVGQNFIVAKQVHTTPNGDKVTWLQFRIPIRTPTSVVGPINGFKSIRFIRMYMTGFTDPIVLRMAQLQLVANQWRVYVPDDISQQGFGAVGEPDDAVINVSTVNIEENGGGTPPYVLPPGVIRDQDVTSNIDRQINEQSLKLSVAGLDDKNARAVYKNIAYDLLNYKRLKMFIHAETDDQNTKDGDMTAFLRLGTDVTQNYYEIEVPLQFTPKGTGPDPELIWKDGNMIDIPIEELINTKLERNEVTNRNLTASYSRRYERENGRGFYILHVRGNPDISAVAAVMIGMRNPAKNLLTGDASDASPKTATIWVNELKVTEFQNKSGWATLGRVNAKLADLANVTATARYSTPGFGSLEQRVSQRERAYTTEYGTSAGISVDKFIPEKLGIKLPMYVSYDRKIVAPQYNPMDPDVLMKKQLKTFDTNEEKKEFQRAVNDITTRRAINFTNFKKVKTKQNPKSHFYDIENFSFTAGYNETKRTSYDIHLYLFQNYKGAVEYNFTSKSKSIEPFKNAKKMNSPYLRLIKDFNINPMPGNLTFRNDIDRRMTRTIYYEAGPFTPPQQPLYEKYFTLTRTYGLGWNLTKSINIDYKANAAAIVDEPARNPGDEAYKDSLWSNFKRFGRLKEYNQSASATYKLPIDKLPLFNWLSADTRYAGGFSWSSGAVAPPGVLSQRDTLGNLTKNNRDISINGKINLETLYNKSKFLKEINNPILPTPKNKEQEQKKSKPLKTDEKKTDKTQQAKKDSVQNRKPELQGMKIFLRSLMLLRSINLSYSLVQTTTLPGYMPVPTYMGVDAKGQYNQTDHLGDILPFLFGDQNPDFRYKAAEKGWISKEREQNLPYLRTKTHNLTARTSVEPFKDFKIQVEMKKSKGSNYSEQFRVDSTESFYVSENPVQTGTYSISFLTLKTSFAKMNKETNESDAFNTFAENRRIIRERHISQGRTQYGLNSQDVLIPAFIAAYSGRPAEKQELSAFPKIPLPNWNISYAGLNRLKFLQKRFSSITLNHVYSSSYNVGNVLSSVLYGYGYITPVYDIDRYIAPDQLNPDSTYAPVYILDAVTIRESFTPLLGLNLRTKGKVSYKIEYRKSRTLILAINNAQVREDLSNDVVFGIGYAKTGAQIPLIRVRGRKIPPLKNELNMRVDFTLRDTRSYQRVLDNASTITGGNLNWQFKPTITYNVSQRVTTQFYFERTYNNPRLSSSFKRTTTSFGIQIRFTLS
ncbi:MAG: cell surface protein SprA [Cytophagaceae bacterium]|nr:cell surface protein SprA [Cytophagaceae bacterium]MDW8456598.1 cell surface protein SprA [Cytophagaceae bacterium]